MSSAISDPDLYRLFHNSFPNTLDTAIKWRGTAANNSDEELTFIITGDINAMWLRDSANQMQSYLPLLATDYNDNSTFRDNSIASLYRGVINLQSRYLLTSPYCNSFQAPPESGIPPATNSAASSDSVHPPYTPTQVFECKYELDSLAAFLQISADYYSATQDVSFFGRFQWIPAVRAVLATAKAMRDTPTYGEDGRVLDSPYTFSRETTRQTETLANDGLGSPVGRDTGLVRSAFRPSDDSTLFQFLVPSNMQFARYLEACAEIVRGLDSEEEGREYRREVETEKEQRMRMLTELTEELKEFAAELRRAISRHGIIPVLTDTTTTASIETIYAYEVDGFGSANVMDDANIPSLLSAPFLGYLNASDPVYQRTRAKILDQSSTNGNPYFMRGPVISAVGGPHAGPGMAWPMASIVRILTSDDDAEIVGELRQLVSSTDGLGLIHESVNSFDASKWTRQW